MSTGTFPRGVQLLNFLYDRMKIMQMSDVGGDASSVMLWLLQNACSPFLEVLSDITATGFVAMTTDPHVSDIVFVVYRMCE